MAFLVIPLDLTGIESSYRQNDYGALFYALTLAHKPRIAVELGTYQGYSALHIAAAMRGALFLVDLWGDYPFRHCAYGDTRKNFDRHGLTASFVYGDALSSASMFENGDVSLLHVDLSNDGDKLEEVFAAWHRKLSPDALVLIEGGSAERDQVEWMVKFRKRPIGDWLRSDWVARNFSYVTLLPFPSLTIMRAK